MSTTTTTTVTSNGYGTTTTVQTVKTVLPNVYNDKGCVGTSKCKGFSVYVPCIPDLYGGLRYCQDIFILGKDGQPLDTSRLDYLDITFNNEYDCPVMFMTTQGGVRSDGLITFLQKKYDGKLFDITPKNFWEHYDDNTFFEIHNTTVTNSDSELCPDDYDAIVIGKDDGECTQFGYILFNPIKYTSDLAVKITPVEGKEADCVCEVNGMPNATIIGQTTPLIDIIDKGEAVLKITSLTPYNESSVAEISRIEITCTKGITDQGKVRICYIGEKLAEIPKTALYAVFRLKFLETDAEEMGAEYVIPCTNIAMLH